MLTGTRTDCHRGAGSDDQGMSLAELVVSITITMILMTLATVFFVQIERSGYKSTLTNQTTADARVTLDSWTSMLRVAGWFDGAQTDRFEEITPTKIVFYANLNTLPTAGCPTSGLPTCGATNLPTKVALMFVAPSGSTDGRLMEVVFNSDNTTPKSVRQVAFNASKTTGQPMFQPYFSSGGPVDVVNTLGCLNGATPTAGLCLQTPPAGAGMLDPTLSATSNTPSAGTLRGTGSLVDSTLQKIGGVTVTFTVSDPTHRSSMDFTGGASVNSGFTS